MSPQEVVQRLEEWGAKAMELLSWALEWLQDKDGQLETRANAAVAAATSSIATSERYRALRRRFGASLAEIGEGPMEHGHE